MIWGSPAGRVLLVGLTLSVVAACAPDPDPGPEWLDDQLGGEATRRALRGRPFNQVIRNASNAELARFADGAEVFDRHLTAGDGLGPDFDDDGCLSCHIDRADGDPVHLPQGFVNRIDPQLGAAVGLGPQAQMRRVEGEPEATLDLVWEIVPGHYDDGTRYELLRPRHELGTGGRYPSHGPSSQRMAPPLIGLGLLEAIPEAALHAASDADDADGDGVSGRVREIADPLDPSRTVTGRFGWKASQRTVESQTLVALDQDMGIDTTGTATSAELDGEELADMIFYNRTIAVPIGRGRGADDVARGAQTFEDIGCASCHTPTQHSGGDAVRGLSDQTFHPFTDLLVHDMGPDLDDGLAEPGAASAEWRTAPLWGLGRRVEVTGRRAFLHDGRARTPTEAVLWHGGEAKAARDAFRRLDADERRDVEAFLASL